MMTKVGIAWGSLFKFLQPAVRGGANAAKPVAEQIASKLPKEISIVKNVPMTHSDILRTTFNGKNLVGKELRRGIDALSPEMKKNIAQAAKSDLSGVENELSRLFKLRSAATQEEYNAIRARMKELQGVKRNLASNMRNLDRTWQGKAKRGLMYAGGAGFLGLDAGYFGPEVYNAIKEKRYGDAALLGGEMALFHALPLGAFGRAVGGRFGSALARAGEPIERMINWGERTKGLTGWMARHPVWTAELGGTPLGMKTQISGLLSGEGMEDAAESAGNLAKSKVRSGARYSDAAHLAQGANEDSLLHFKKLRGGY